MAFIKLKDGRGLEVSRQQGHEIWAVLQGEINATPEQEKFANSVEKISLSFIGAPESYILQNIKLFIDWCKRDWLVDYSGNPSKPQTAEQWATAKKYNFAP